MLHIILGILKVIFILIGIVLGLILGIVLIALFVPVRYRIQAIKESGRMQVMAHITFLLHILSVRIKAGPGEAPGIAVRIFGILLPLSGNRRPAVKSRKGSAPSGKSDNGRTGQASDRNTGDIEDTYETKSGRDGVAGDAVHTSDGAKPDGDGVAGDAVHTNDGAKPDGDGVAGDAMHTSDGAEPDGDGIAGGMERTYSETDGEGKDYAFVGRLRAVLYRLQAAWRRLLTLPERLRQIWMRLCRLAEKPGALPAFLQEYEVNAILRDSLGYLRRLLKHYTPRRLDGWLKFGTGDPALTGELTGVLYLLLPARAEGFSIEPCFTEKLFETELDAVGHVRACHLIFLLIRMISDRRVRRLIRAYRKRK